MTHRPYLERAAHVLSAISLAVGLLAAAPIAEAFREIPTTAPAAVRPPLGTFGSGDLVARLAVPRLGIDAAVYEGLGPESLSRGAGHLPGTALPGEDASAEDTLLAISRNKTKTKIETARIGKTVTMSTPFGVLRYRVAERRVTAPDAVGRLRKNGRTITIVTPYPADAIGPAPLRLALVLKPRGRSLFSEP